MTRFDLRSKSELESESKSESESELVTLCGFLQPLEQEGKLSDLFSATVIFGYNSIGSPTNVYPSMDCNFEHDHYGEAFMARWWWATNATIGEVQMNVRLNASTSNHIDTAPFVSAVTTIINLAIP